MDSEIDINEIYKLLPRIDCGQCPSKSCMAFAAALREDCRRLTECTRITPYGIMLIKDLLCRGQ